MDDLEPRRRFLKPLVRVPVTPNADRAANSVEQLVDQACTRCFVSDRPVAVAFSGGIDSTVVLSRALAQADVASVLTLYASDRAHDEDLACARAVASVLGVDLVEVPVSLPDADAVTRLMQDRLDGPAAEPMVVHNDELHRAAGGLAGVLVGGHGADEVFAGYARYHAVWGRRKLPAVAVDAASAGWERLQRVLLWDAFCARYLDSSTVRDIMEQQTNPIDDWTLDVTGAEPDPVFRAQVLDLLVLQAYDNLRVPDENGMVHCVEVRSPYFDVDLLAGVFSLPENARFEPAAPKRVLRERIKDPRLAPYLRLPKVGFDDAFQYSRWIAAHAAELREVIASGPLGDLGVLRPGFTTTKSTVDGRLLWRMFALSVGCDAVAPRRMHQHVHHRDPGRVLRRLCTIRPSSSNGTETYDKRGDLVRVARAVVLRRVRGAA